jgi:GNAT superfamily N-acetyltransferase
VAKRTPGRPAGPFALVVVPAWPEAAVPLSFRFAADSEEEIDAIVALVESAYRGPTSRAGWTTEADLLDGQRTDAAAVRDLISTEEGGVLLAEEEGLVVGCCHLEHRSDRAAYFGMFSVVPTRQGQGRGRAIVTEAERVAREEWNATRMLMTVIRQRHDLIAWYRRLGYRATGETEPFPYGNERYGIPRRPDLEFVVLAKSLL